MQKRPNSVQKRTGSGLKERKTPERKTPQHNSVQKRTNSGLQQPHHPKQSKPLEAQTAQDNKRKKRRRATMPVSARKLMTSFAEDEAFDATDNAARAHARAEKESDDQQGMSAAAHQPSPLHLTDSRLHKHERGGRRASAHKAENIAAQWMRRVCSQLRPAAAAAAGAHADSDPDDDEVCCRQPTMNREPFTAAA